MGEDARPLVELDQVRKSFGDNVVLDGVNLTVERGSATVIAGPSGSGKSTMLRCINGLEPVDSGEVRASAGGGPGRGPRGAGGGARGGRAAVGRAAGPGFGCTPAGSKAPCDD